METTTVALQHNAALDAAAPIVASFRNGPPPPTKRQNLSMEVYENATKKQRLVLASSERVAYQGANFGYLSAANDMANYAVGIYDANTHEVRLCNLPQIYVMQQTIKGSSDNVDENRGDDLSYMEKKRALVDRFGSKKSKRIQRSMEENVVSVDHVSGATTIAETLKKQMVKAQEEARKRDDANGVDAALAASRNELLPPFNADAASPDQVYNVRKFLPSNVMEALLMRADQWIESLDTSGTTEFTSTMALGTLPTQLLMAMRTPYDRTKMAYLVFLSFQLEMALMHFPMKKSAAMLSEDKDIPLVVLRHMLTLFAEQQANDNGRSTFFAPKQKKDKLVLYMLVVALTINEFSLDLQDLATDLKRSAVTLTTYCRQLGCSVDKGKSDAAAASKKQVYRAVLSVPLRFPAPKRGGGGGARGRR